MPVEEINNVMKTVSQIALDEIPVSDQVELFLALESFAKTVKSVVARNMDKLQNNETFIVKL